MVRGGEGGRVGSQCRVDGLPPPPSPFAQARPQPHKSRQTSGSTPTPCGPALARDTHTPAKRGSDGRAGNGDGGHVPTSHPNRERGGAMLL